jgi:hypothetical protein
VVSGLSVIVRVPLKAAAEAGAHVTDTVQLPKAGTLTPHVLLLMAKVGDPTLILGAGLKVIATFWRLVSVTTCGELVVPCGTLPKGTLVGATVA